MQSPERLEAGPAAGRLGAVVIGRNEGERLRRCLQSLAGGVDHVVYVDSGSTDGSVALATAMGADVVELDLRVPFNAGRARNEGFKRLCTLRPDLSHVQFVDGDCELAADWCAKAAAFLDAHPDVAVVAGRRRERHPEDSLYNRFCAMEWDTHPVGEAKACGGDAMMRAEALNAVGGYRLDLVAGEEPELCIRLRAAGWRIWFLPEQLTLHDAAMTRFGQWCKRAVRSGYGCMQGARLHGGPPEFHCLRTIASAWLWAFCIPLATLLLLLWFGPPGLLLLLLYPLQFLRLALLDRKLRNASPWWPVFAVVMKFPHLWGQLQWLMHQCLRKKAQLIEYKSA